MKTIFLVICCIAGYALSAQNRKGDIRLTEGSESHELYFAVKAQYSFRNSTDPVRQLFLYLPELTPLLAGYDYKISKGIPIPEQQLAGLEADAITASASGSAVTKLLNIFRVRINNPTNSRLYELALQLEQIDAIDYASLMPLSPVQPPVDVAPPTGNYQTAQGYLNANPGVNIKALWSAGVKGKGIRVRDVEYGFNKDHEDLNPLNQSIASGMVISTAVPVAYIHHGTAVSGIMNAPDNGYGISGMVAEIDEFILYPEWADTTYNRIKAISAAIADSRRGDVIVYEMQTGGVRGQYVPAEYDNVVWDLTKAAADAGIVIVAAAGNGGQDLDSPGYAAYMARGNSGAIIVGAGTPAVAHSRLSFSTYGKRVDLQGWGSNVVTTGYGDFATLGGYVDQTYTRFSGTSSATPIVASCVIALQSYYHKETGAYLTTDQLLDILKTTGIPQGDTANGSIGPLPDMSAAFAELKSRMTGIDAFGTASGYALYPNPVSGLLQVSGVAYSATEQLRVRISNVLGQQVFDAPLDSRMSIDISSYASGIYFVRILKGNELLQSGKIVKQ